MDPASAATLLSKLECEGFAVIPNFLTAEQLEALRREAEVLYELSQEGRGGGTCDGSRWGAECKDSCIYEGVPGHLCTPDIKRSFDVYKLHRTLPPLGPSVWQLMFESQLTQLVLAVLGPGAVLFNDQYIIKPPLSPLSSFRWHRDSDWCRTSQANYHPYISVWIALDAMHEENGCFIVRPGSHATPAQHSSAQRGARSSGSGSGGSSGHIAEQPQEPGSDGQPPLPLCVEPGTAIITSDTVLHCSGPNRSRHMRRAWMPQFSTGPITWVEGGQPVGLAIPLAPPNSCPT